jgi:hypothetical protein
MTVSKRHDLFKPPFKAPFKTPFKSPSETNGDDMNGDEGRVERLTVGATVTEIEDNSQSTVETRLSDLEQANLCSDTPNDIAPFPCKLAIFTKSNRFLNDFQLLQLSYLTTKYSWMCRFLRKYR